jgi:fluoroacetyl-CoA thioesterase
VSPRKTKSGTRSSKRASKRGVSGTPKRKLEKTAAAFTEHHFRLGLEGTSERVVQLEHTIQVVNPNLPAVFSTPSMIGLMEHATVQALVPELPPGAISVGTRIEVDHLKAVGVGATVRAWARFVKYEGRFLVFDVEARSGEHLIGRGRVFRAVVHPGEHGAKAQARVQQ